MKNKHIENELLRLLKEGEKQVGHMKDNIKKETGFPGYKVTKKATDKAGEFNKESYTNTDKEMSAYEKASTTTVDGKFIPPKNEVASHDDNLGMQDLKYDGINDEFTKKAKMAIEGDETMGNEDTEATEGPEDTKNPNFGKDFIKATKEKRKAEVDSTITKTQFGDDIEIVDADPIAKNKKIAVESVTSSSIIKEEVEFETAPVKNEAGLHTNNTHFAIHKLSNSIAYTWDYKGYDPEELKASKDDYFFDDIKDTVESMVDKYKKSDYVIVTKKNLAKKGIDLNDYTVFRGQKYGNQENTKDNNPEIKEGKKMKRLRFKKPFNGLDEAVNLIPEGYKVADKEFEMTDGNETYRVRWEGTLTEGEAIILSAKNTKLISEDKAHMLHLMGFKSEDTLGKIKGKDRIDENETFNTILNKTKSLLKESENNEKNNI